MSALRYLRARIVRVGVAGCAVVVAAAGCGGGVSSQHAAGGTPIRHLVVIYQENRSFDNYFGTYPQATNPIGEPAFHPQPDTPAVNGLSTALRAANPNLANPKRLDRSQQITCDNNHAYRAMQRANNGGRMNNFVQSVGPTGPGCDPTLPMGYYDGNTVTALWNYAQHFAMSDNTFTDTFGPSVPQGLNLIAGQTHGSVPSARTKAVAHGTLIANLPATHDDCDIPPANDPTTMQMSGRNVGDLLNAKGVSWGWFTGGFKPTAVINGKAVCRSSHKNIAGITQGDYFGAEDDPFQYYSSTNNAHHLSPSSPAMIGRTDQAKHQYDLADFWLAVDEARMPAVSFLRAPSYQQGHAGYSDPSDEQRFLVETINRLQQLPTWPSTAIVITWDESGGWYDHVLPPLVNPSDDKANDALTGPGTCGMATPGAYLDRCGYGPRIPMLVISPYSKRNFVQHAVTAQSAITRFIEDNWALGHLGDQSFDVRAGTINAMFNFSRPDVHPLILDPVSGEPLSATR